MAAYTTISSYSMCNEPKSELDSRDDSTVAQALSLDVNNAFIRKSTTYYTLVSVEGSPYSPQSLKAQVESSQQLTKSSLADRFNKTRFTP
jgi:hypothetical protein